jgi:hypothetical protein
MQKFKDSQLTKDLTAFSASNSQGGYNPYRKMGYNAAPFMNDDPTLSDEVVLNRQVEDYEQKFIEYLISMQGALGKNKINIREIQRLTDIFQALKKEQTDDYYEALVHPEHSKGSKIPSTVPVPSSSFQLHSQISVAPNASGNAFVVFNPYYLAGGASLGPGLGVGQTTSSFYVNNDPSLTGSGAVAIGTTIATSVGQVIPNVYNQYRLVSASIVVKYVGRLDIVQGAIGGAIIFDPNVAPINVSTANPALDKYGDFNLAQDSYYFQDNMTLNGMRELFFPLDSTYEQYLTTGTAKNGFAFLIYIQDGVPTASNYKVDVYLNFEALADVSFLNYIPQSQCQPMDQSKKEEYVRAVQMNPITSAVIERPMKGADSGFSYWNKIISTMGDFLPSLGTLASMFPGVGKILGPMLQAGGGMIKRSNLPNQSMISGKQSMDGSFLGGI